MPKQFVVWLLGERIGMLLQVAGRLNFVYLPEWLAQAAAATAQPGAVAGASAGSPTGPLSQSLPLRAEPFDDRTTRPFFACLLSEGKSAASWPRRCKLRTRTTLPCSTASAVNVPAPSRCWSPVSVSGHPTPPNPLKRALA